MGGVGRHRPSDALTEFGFFRRDLIPPQGDPNIARSPSGEVDDLKSNLISAGLEILFPKVVEFLRITGKRFFPAGLALIYGPPTIGT